MVSGLGNEEIAKRLEGANAQRDEIVALIEARLKGVRDTQLAEVGLTERGANWQHWREIADSHLTEISRPEPTRWHRVARAYEQALQAVCRGDLDRGRQLARRALEIEGELTEQLTTLAPSPDATGALDGGPAVAAGTAVPAGPRDLVHDILNTTASMPHPKNKPRTADPWWTAELQDEDDDDDEP
ncbi:MAG: hypothetical protein KTR31_00140 [Myxococcales bacterium]|nr:hypothetical protein [Myxococcales bacterium]